MKMEGVRRAVLVLLVACCVTLVITRQASAAQHVVGGSQGWDESTDFDSWTSAQTFKVGDQLMFKYSQGLHSVVELAGEAAYKNCDLGTSVNSLSTGNDVVKLDKPGTRYFACGTLGHCGQGMKVKVTTVAGNAPSTPASSSSSSSSPASASAASSEFPGSASLVSLMVLVILCAFSVF
ncbi:Phytocyanin domain-containing protein [Psidium guajava]|nr:Phytocyanin domain-containing protein [Psidium guajava]